MSDSARPEADTRIEKGEARFSGHYSVVHGEALHVLAVITDPSVIDAILEHIDTRASPAVSRQSHLI